MIYNYSRFESIFEFGISYQLTAINGNHMNFSFLRIIFGFIDYLFGMFNYNVSTRLLTSNIPSLSFISKGYYIEALGGGIITTSVIGIILLFFPYIIKKATEIQKSLKIFMGLSLTLGFILIAIISNQVGSVGRYMMDFNYLFMINIVLLSVMLYNKAKDKKLFSNIYIILSSISILINFMLSLTNIW
jgi:hypothetical protein